MIIWDTITIDITYLKGIELPPEIPIPRIMLTRSVNEFLGANTITSKTFLITVKRSYVE